MLPSSQLAGQCVKISGLGIKAPTATQTHSLQPEWMEGAVNVVQNHSHTLTPTLCPGHSLMKVLLLSDVYYCPWKGSSPQGNSAQLRPDLSLEGVCFSLIIALTGYLLQSKQTLQSLCKDIRPVSLMASNLH